MYPVEFDGILAILVLKQDFKLFLFVCCTAPKRTSALKLKQEQRMSGVLSCLYPFGNCREETCPTSFLQSGKTWNKMR